MGETPSPEMVAASGEKTGLPPMAAAACLVTIVAGLLLSAWLSSKVNLIEQTSLENPPNVLARKARDYRELSIPSQVNTVTQ